MEIIQFMFKRKYFRFETPYLNNCKFTLVDNALQKYGTIFVGNQ